MINSGAFLQSPEWEKFQNSLGRKTWRIDNALVIKMDFCLGLYFLYSPKLDFRFQILDFRFIEQIKKIAKEERAIFWRVEPAEAPPKEFIKTKDIQSRCTLITDISKPEEELLSAMHPKTRYNIRLSQKHGVKVENFQFPISNFQSNSKSQFSNPNKIFDKFYSLLQKTAGRQNIKLHAKEYYKKLLFGAYNNYSGRYSYCNEIFIAYYEDTPVACAMVNFYQDTTTYLHGGSDPSTSSGTTVKNLMAPYLLHWKIIKTAKSRGIHYYDWWGIDEAKWPGITRFKLGFGGDKICAPGTFDLPIDKFLYFWYKLFRR